MRYRGVVATAAATGATALVLATTAGGVDGGFKTGQDAMLTGMNGATVQPLMTVGDTLPSGYRYEAIPDGIALRIRDKDRVDLLVNHETSTVPFPFTFPGSASESNQNDFDNSQVSQLVLNRHTGGVLRADMVIRSSAGFQRFCSNYLATSAEGFDRPILLTNEEAIDWVNRKGTSWPATIGDDAARQAGAVVAYDVQRNKVTTIWGMGRHNHENSVAIPGYDELVVLSGDDSFVSNPPQAQLYSYLAGSTAALLKDEGDLWAFVADDPNVNDYYDFAVGTSMSVSGKFVKVPKDIATGRNPDGTDLVAADKGYPPPPDDGTWQRNPFAPPPLKGVDGPQWVLEHWGDLNNVFQFIRVEDIAYDKRPGMGNVVYVIDSGRGLAPVPPATSAPPGASTNGRVWKLVLDPDDPTTVLSLSILIEGDDRQTRDPERIHQPDNLESTPSSLLIQEDPGSGQQFPFGSTDPRATSARIWKYDLATGAMSVVAVVDQSADEGPTDVDGPPAVVQKSNLGAWESSGIVDASSVFGPGTFLVNVQAHTLWIEKAPGDDNFAPAGPDFTYKREGGQLLLLTVPGA
jgi:hypothetical protein